MFSRTKYNICGIFTHFNRHILFIRSSAFDLSLIVAPVHRVWVVSGLRLFGASNTHFPTVSIVHRLKCRNSVMPTPGLVKYAHACSLLNNDFAMMGDCSLCVFPYRDEFEFEVCGISVSRLVLERRKILI
jgi:hypothetical protein